MWHLKTNGSFSAPTLITDNGLIFAGSRDGSVYILKNISNTLNKKSSAVRLEWPTYLGNNQRTGDQKSIFTDVKKKETAVDQFSLMQNYPNPFNPSTRIVYSLPEESQVKITIMNILGAVVKEFNLGFKNGGVHELEWNASEFSSGVYLYKISAASLHGYSSFSCVRKMILIK